MKKALAIIAWRRPDLLKILLSSLRANNLSADWTINISIDVDGPTIEQMRRALQSFPEIVARSNIIENRKPLGLPGHPQAAIRRLFVEQNADVGVYIEEDTVLSPDAFDLIDWFAHHPRRDEFVALNLATYWSYREWSHLDPSVVYAVDTPHYCGHPPWIALGFALTRQMFTEHWAKHWSDDKRGWAWSMFEHFRKHPDLRGLYPAVARLNHTGATRGKYCTIETHKRRFGDLRIHDRRRPADGYQIREPHEFVAEVASLSFRGGWKPDKALAVPPGVVQG